VLALSSQTEALMPRSSRRAASEIAAGKITSRRLTPAFGTAIQHTTDGRAKVMMPSQPSTNISWPLPCSSSPTPPNEGRPGGNPIHEDRWESVERNHHR
jgi:hypothetical protein